MGVITISRQFGAGGRTLGRMIADKMGYTFIDNELIQLIAKKAQVSQEWVRSIEKEAGGKFMKFISGIVPRSIVDRVLDNERGYIDEEIYSDLLFKIITQIAEAGNAVILGRGSQYILENRSDAYHVLLVARKSDRRRFMEEHYELTPSQAGTIVKNEDRRRVNLYRKFKRGDYDSPDHYHLILNMSKVHIDKACSLICRLAGYAD